VTEVSGKDWRNTNGMNMNASIGDESDLQQFASSTSAGSDLIWTWPCVIDALNRIQPAASLALERGYRLREAL
jgi:hypothetical protein